MGLCFVFDLCANPSTPCDVPVLTRHAARADLCRASDACLVLPCMLGTPMHACHPIVRPQAMWDGCNECGGGGLYQTFAMPTVAGVDTSRPIWPSCPAPGWTGGVDRLSSRPDGGHLVTGAGDAGSPRPSGFPFGQEAHGPYTVPLTATPFVSVPPRSPPPTPLPPCHTVPCLVIIRKQVRRAVVRLLFESHSDI